MFKTLNDKLDLAFKHLKGQTRITDLNISNVIKDIRKALIDADVNFNIVKEFTDKVKTEAIGTKVIQAVRPDQLMVKIVQDELVNLLGGSVQQFIVEEKFSIILLAGLQGTGKTTFAGKLAYYLKNNKNKKTLLVACDVYRPAAVEQLSILAQQIGTNVYSNKESNNPVQIALEGIDFAKANHFDTVIIDTAGRLSIDTAMMDEILQIKKATKPNHILYVLDSMMGQDALSVAKSFHDVTNFSGVVLTKIDSDARGGVALSVKYTLQTPIYFSSTGEKVDNLEVFYPDRIAQRILGMGDIATFVEKAQTQFDDAQAEKLEKKLRKNQFDLQDFLEQTQMIQKMGSLKDMLSYIPGVSKAVKDVDIKDDAFKPMQALIQSMTPAERKNPDIIDMSRKNRIIKGSGRSMQEINQLLKQFEEMKKMIQKMGKNPMAGLSRLGGQFKR
ncbi:MAG: signal recognition particle protein [Phycisphaerales bacterium]|nr:signal recognition particle protein [Phycisphaerales bacterium]